MEKFFSWGRGELTMDLPIINTPSPPFSNSPLCFDNAIILLYHYNSHPFHHTPKYPRKRRIIYMSGVEVAKSTSSSKYINVSTKIIYVATQRNNIKKPYCFYTKTSNRKPCCCHTRLNNKKWSKKQGYEDYLGISNYCVMFPSVWCFL